VAVAVPRADEDVELIDDEEYSAAEPEKKDSVVSYSCHGYDTAAVALTRISTAPDDTAAGGAGL